MAVEGQNPIPNPKCNFNTKQFIDNRRKNRVDQDGWFYDKNIGSYGTMMFKGEGGDRKLSEGVALWERAAAMGDPQARANLDALGALDASSFPLVDEEVNLNPHL